MHRIEFTPEAGDDLASFAEIRSESRRRGDRNPAPARADPGDVQPEAAPAQPTGGVGASYRDVPSLLRRHRRERGRQDRCGRLPRTGTISTSTARNTTCHENDRPPHASPDIAGLLEQARNDDIVVRLPDGSEFLLVAIDDFDREVARSRANPQLMALLEARARQRETVPLEKSSAIGPCKGTSSLFLSTRTVSLCLARASSRAISCGLARLLATSRSKSSMATKRNSLRLVDGRRCRHFEPAREDRRYPVTRGEGPIVFMTGRISRRGCRDRFPSL